MEIQEEKLKVHDLVQAVKAGSLIRNDEYQRGLAWSRLQKVAFVDSLFRGYPVPALFLHEIESKGLRGSASKRWEIVDGQQRLNALREFSDDKLQLEPAGQKSKLRLPKTVADRPAPWADRRYTQLDKELRRQYDDTELLVVMIGTDAQADEVRDLFIRLQSGTALSRQQIRDAWPGNLGPFIESLAGKLDRPPSVGVFSLVDKRGQRSEDEDVDAHVANRQICAQLLKIFVARANDPYAFPSVSANELDSLYHQYTDFDGDGPLSAEFRKVLEQASNVFIEMRALTGKQKNKFRRLDVTATAMFLQDAGRNNLLRLDRGELKKLARSLHDFDGDRPVGRSTSASTLKAYYEWYRKAISKDIGIQLDPRREFADDQKRALFESAGGECAICEGAVEPADAEYDHFPVPYRDGGKTEIENGRLVHMRCHPRGRPVDD